MIIHTNLMSANNFDSEMIHSIHSNVIKITKSVS